MPSPADRLADAHALVVGDGALGRAVRRALGDAGIGRITVATTTGGAGPVSEQAVVRAELPFAPGRTFELLLDADVVLDATEDSATRYLANDAAAIRGIPLVWGSTSADVGRIGVAWDERGADYRDLAPEGAPADDGPGTDPGLPPIVARLMAAETVTVLTSGGEGFRGRVLLYDPARGDVEESTYRRDPGAARPGSLEERTAMTDPEPARTVSPGELHAELEAGNPPALLDVRQPWEFESGSLPGAISIPLHELPDRIGELDPAAPLVVVCHVGMRSARALDFLMQAGFTRARNLAGGLDAWSLEVDPTFPRY